MITRRVLGTVAAIILFMAGLGAGVTSLRAVKEGDIMSSGRRVTHLIQRESNPGQFWVETSINAVIGIVLGGLSVWVVIRSYRKPK